MKKTISVLLVFLLLLTAGCTDRKENSGNPTDPVAAPNTAEPSEPVAAPKAAEPSDMPTESDDTVDVTQAATEHITADAVTSASQTEPEAGKCCLCGTAENSYDGYCYYCHPDFLFTCANCGYEQPYHRTESGLCYDCEAAADSVTGATPTQAPVACKSCGAPEDYADGYCFYCHPDNGFHCSSCGYYWPEPRPASGMCSECEAAADSVTGATP